MNTKNLLLMFALLTAASTTFAQEGPKTDSNFSWGPKVGVDLTTPTTDEATIKSSVKSNFQLGIFLQFGKKFFVQPEFYYATRKEKIQAGTIITENKINALKIPVLLRCKWAHYGGAICFVCS
jgi:hypothetical protein